MNSRQFLLLCGLFLVILGILGMFVLGPTPENSTLGGSFWLDQGENVAHLLFGIIALGTYYMVTNTRVLRRVVVLLGAVATIATLVGFMNANSPVPNVGVANLENPADNVLNLVLAIWAFASAFMGKKD
jgi:hypothetical protein